MIRIIPLKKKKLNKILIHKIASVETTMRLNSIKNIKFNELFGAGSKYFQCGEENIFLKDCIHKKRHIRYIPMKIASLLENRPSTWFTGFNKKRFIDQGAIYYELSHFLCILFILRFAVLKHSSYKKNMNIVHAIYYMLCGVIEYIDIKRRNS
jgi:hypothetical protein